MLIAIIVLLFVMYEARKEHERILEKLERMERVEEEKKKNIE